jgi:hypothetical protein
MASTMRGHFKGTIQLLWWDFKKGISGVLDTNTALYLLINVL